MSSSWSETPLSSLRDYGLEEVFTIAGLYGIYLVTFALAVCFAWRSGYSGRARIRVALILMFFVVTACLVMRIGLFCISVSGLSGPLDMTVERQSINLVIAINVLTCLAGLLADAVLAWRAYVVFGKRLWTKWLLSAAVLSDFVGSLANIGYADAIRALPNMQSQAVTSPAHFASIALGNQFIVIWAWYFLVINTALTTSIIYSILRNSLRYERFYGKIICALVESALVSWIGLLRFGISGAISFNSLGSARDVAGITTLPLAFGLSQSLIIARLGLSQYVPALASSSTQHSDLVFAADSDSKARMKPEVKFGSQDIELATVKSHAVG